MGWGRACYAAPEAPSHSLPRGKQAVREGAGNLVLVTGLLGTAWAANEALNNKFAASESKLEDRLGGRIDALGARLDARLDAQAARMEAKFDQEDKKFFQLLLALRRPGDGPPGDGPGSNGAEPH